MALLALPGCNAVAVETPEAVENLLAGGITAVLVDCPADLADALSARGVLRVLPLAGREYRLTSTRSV